MNKSKHLMTPGFLNKINYPTTIKDRHLRFPKEEIHLGERLQV